MPAHLRPIMQHRCNRDACDRWATHELRNTTNLMMARYCQEHADEALADYKQATGVRIKLDELLEAAKRV